MTGPRKRSLRVAFGAVLLPALFSAGAARADVAVSIQYESESQLELARRLTSELSSEGYAVEISAAPEPTPCDPSGAGLAAVPHGTKVWIRLRSGPSGDDSVVASICYLGALPFLQQASVSAPSAESQKLALATAEALNGLRSKLPPLSNNPERVAPRTEDTKNHLAEPTHGAHPTERLVNSLVLGTALVRSFPDFPAQPGIVGSATLGVVRSFGITIDAFVPTSGRELASPEVTATVRTSWLRMGPRFDWALGDFQLSGAALAGPAVTWATAVARPPRVGGADVAPGAVLSLAAIVEYPRTSTIFARGSASASALLPNVRLDLGDGATAPLGAWPLEASIGFGARWGPP